MVSYLLTMHTDQSVGLTKEPNVSTFLFSYRSPKDYQPGPKARQAWAAYFSSIGANLLERGNPVFESASLGVSESGAQCLGGYSIIVADDLAAAIAIAKDCPILLQGGVVEVGLITETDGDERRVHA